MVQKHDTHGVANFINKKIHIKKKHIAGDSSWIKFQVYNYNRYITIQLIFFLLVKNSEAVSLCVVKTKAINRCVLIQPARMIARKDIT